MRILHRPAPARQPDVISYSAAISACEKAAQCERALEILDEMKRRGVAPNVFSYSAAISACEKGGRWERALALLAEMRTRGVAPDVIVYNSTISACATGARWDHALALLSEMEARGGLAPNAITFSAAIEACDAAGEAAEARRLYTIALEVRAAIDRPRSPRLVVVVVPAVCDCGRVDRRCPSRAG